MFILSYMNGLVRKIIRLNYLIYEADFEAAISATGFGSFHLCLLAITGLIYTNTAIGVTTISFVLPGASCDFTMKYHHMGWMSASPMLGMVLGSYFWGCVAETKGRKVVLVSTLLLDGFMSIISSFAQTYILFMACRFVNGFAVAGAMSICFLYLGEFQQTKYIRKILCWMEMFWTLGLILLRFMAWVIISITVIRFKRSYIHYDSWNWFVAACGIPSLLLGFWMFCFPESPKFMMESGNYDDALACLKSIYRQNTGDAPDNYPYKSLKQKMASQSSMRGLSLRNPEDLKELFTEIWTQTKSLCRAPYRKCTILTCLIQFGVTSSYYTFMTWFPEVFNRYEEFESSPSNTSATIYSVAKAYRPRGPYDCFNMIAPIVHKQIFIIGLACIPTTLLLPFGVHKLCAKFLLIFSLGLTGVVTFGLIFTWSSTMTLVLSCIFEALASLAIRLVFYVVVDLFPTNLSASAGMLTQAVGRSGAFIGTLFFGYLIGVNCIIPIVVFSAFLFIAGILCFFLPKTGQQALG